MQVTAWNNGAETYGIRIGIENRERFFDREWNEVRVDLDGQLHRFALTDSFWRQCPEIRDTGDPVIRHWLATHRTLEWPKGDPPTMTLVPQGENRFRLVP